jgi:Ca-activated chloride channel homolog
MTMKLQSLKALTVLAALTAPALADAPKTMIVMDGSGSMWGQIDGRAKLEIARETVSKVLGALPAGQELGLMAYGHRAKGQCEDIELIVPPAQGMGPEIAAQVNKMRFLGKTPLSESVRRAAEALRYGEEAATVVLVTDGLETCNADPCALGRELEAAGLNFTAHVIGFGLTKAEGAQVACLATETGGQYLQASDADALTDALSATVTAKLPAPQPLPVPEPTPVLPTASLSAPDTAPAGTVMRVAFEGPHEEFDYIHILDAKGERQAEKVVEEAPYVDIRLPFEVGAYEIAYSYRSSDIIARKALTIAEAPVSLKAPETAPAGATIAVEWTGPAAQFDYINLLDAAGERVAEAAIGDENPVMLGLPFLTGDFTLTYLFQSQEVIFSRPIALTEAPVSISAPEMAQVGTEVAITWVGPNATYDNIQLYRQADDERITYQYLGETNQLIFAMPDEPGIYEFRYRFWDATTIFVQPIVVTLDKVEAAPTNGGLTIVPVQIVAPADFAQQPIQWSAEPLDPHPLAPEALAMPEALAGTWAAELYPGRWRIYGEAPAGVTAGKGFAADITVTADAGQSFEIPLTPFETMGMGEDAPMAGGPVPIKIKGEYEGLFTRWQATSASGQVTLVLGSELEQQGWDTALDAGRWLIEGFSEGSETQLYAAVVDVAAEGPREITVQRTSGTSETPIALPNDELAESHCAGAVACHHADKAGGVQYLLLPGWAAGSAARYETAGGVAAENPSAEFYVGLPFAVAAALNPRQWDGMLGPCSEIELGRLCSMTDADPAAIALLTTSLRPL